MPACRLSFSMLLTSLGLLLAAWPGAAVPAGVCELPGLRSVYPSVPLYLAPVTRPNVLMFFDNSVSMSTRLPNSTRTRLQAAKAAAKEVVGNYPDIRWGLFTFDPNAYTTAGKLVLPIADGSQPEAGGLTHLQRMATEIDALQAQTNTPLSEAFIEMSRYFRGLSTVYRKAAGSPAYTSPVQYRCQNNAILMMTDGEPYEDDDFRVDGDALFGGLSNSQLKVDGALNVLPKLTGAAFGSDLFPDGSQNDIEGFSWNTAGFVRQYLRTYTVGFTIDHAYLKKAAQAGGGLYFTASDAASLRQSFNAILADINNRNAAATPPAAGSGKPTSVVFSRFDPKTWTSELVSYGLDGRGNLDPAQRYPVQLPAAAERLIYTSYPTQPAGMWTCPMGGGQYRLTAGAVLSGQRFDSPLASDTLTFGEAAADVIRHLRGSPAANERNPNGGLPWLGDIIDSRIEMLADGAAFAVGANDGMLHLFTETSPGSGQYRERLAYVPFNVLTRLPVLRDAGYGSRLAHTYFVNGPVVSETAEGRHYLVGTLAQGGRGLFALDVTSALTPATAAVDAPGQVVLWERGGQADNDPLLGHVFGRPVIARVRMPVAGAGWQAGAVRWAVITGNGYDSPVRRGWLLVHDLLTGTRVAQLQTDDSPDNGLSGPAVLDSDGDGVADWAYAGDLKGRVWRFALGGVADWSQGSGTAFWHGVARQPVTATPALVRRSDGPGYMVLFGTGRLLYSEDKPQGSAGSALDVQSVYGLWDDPAGLRPTHAYGDREDQAGSGPGRLARQSVDAEGSTTVTLSGSATVRTYETRRTTRRSFMLGAGADTFGGWYLDLLPASGIPQGERVLYEMVPLGNGRVDFSTQVPFLGANQCTAGGTGWVLSLDPLTGSRPVRDPWDLDEDGRASVADRTAFAAGQPEVITGYRSQVGMPSALAPVGMARNRYVWRRSVTQSGQINNRLNPYIDRIFQGGLRQMYGGAGGGGAEGPLTLPWGAAGGPGRRLAWRELF